MVVAALLFAAAVAAPVVPAGDFIPDGEDFRTQPIAKAAGEKDWPFMTTRGLLMCAYVLKNPTVYYVPTQADGDPGYPYHISNDIAQMALVNRGQTGVLQPYDSLEQLLVRLHPYVSLGQRLCKQPAGTVVPEADL